MKTFPSSHFLEIGFRLGFYYGEEKSSPFFTTRTKFLTSLLSDILSLKNMFYVAKKKRIPSMFIEIEPYQFRGIQRMK